jgi:SAM-dependent methyltransferase
MSQIINYLDRQFYPSHQDNWDNIMFRNLTLKHLEPNLVLLDAGAGSGFLPQMNFKDFVQKAIGVDPSPMVKENPFLHEAHIGFCNDMPYLASNSVDVAVSNNVLEHVVEVDSFLAEIYRVLKPGGVYIVKTPNRFHYMAVIASLTPTSFHKWFNRLRGVPSEDVFPTQYRINTKKALYAQAMKAGFEVDSFELVEGRPEYVRIFFPLYLLGIVYERIVNSLKLEQLKIVYFAVLKK